MFTLLYPRPCKDLDWKRIVRELKSYNVGFLLLFQENNNNQTGVTAPLEICVFNPNIQTLTFTVSACNANDCNQKGQFKNRQNKTLH